MKYFKVCLVFMGLLTAGMAEKDLGILHGNPSSAMIASTPEAPEHEIRPMQGIPNNPSTELELTRRKITALKADNANRSWLSPIMWWNVACMAGAAISYAIEKAGPPPRC